jgi:hypothetical protein
MLSAADVCMNIIGLGDPVGFESLEDGRASQRKTCRSFIRWRGDSWQLDNTIIQSIALVVSIGSRRSDRPQTCGVTIRESAMNRLPCSAGLFALSAAFAGACGKIVASRPRAPTSIDDVQGVL